VPITEWTELAEWWDQGLGDEGDLWHRTFLDPAFFAALGPVDGLRVLEVACGNGHNTRRLARMGATVTAVDISEGIIALNRQREAREPLGITYLAADAANLASLPNESFDLAVSQMGLMDIPDAAGAISEMGRTLRPGGRFLALICHPCFDIPENSAWVWEKAGFDTAAWRKVGRYASPFEAPMQWCKGGETILIMAYHRPLSWYVRAIRDAGMVLTGLEEPTPGEEFIAQQQPDGAWMTEVPLHVIFEAKKISV
jgi:SAM-dependent methyltransferase